MSVTVYAPSVTDRAAVTQDEARRMAAISTRLTQGPAPRHCDSCGYLRRPSARGTCPDCGVPI